MNTTPIDERDFSYTDLSKPETGEEQSARMNFFWRDTASPPFRT
jgi:hypothetical protein